MVAVVLLAAMASGSVAADPSVALPAAHDRDVLGRPLAPVFDRGRPVLVLFANRGSKATLAGPAQELALKFEDGAFTTVAVVDLRDLPRALHPFARGRLQDELRKSVRSYRRAREEQGDPVDPAAPPTAFFAADPEGRSHAALGLPKGFRTPYAALVGPGGEVLAEGPFPASAPEIEAALRRFRDEAR
jgi:hypothetical protein